MPAAHISPSEEQAPEQALMVDSLPPTCLLKDLLAVSSPMGLDAPTLNHAQWMSFMHCPALAHLHNLTLNSGLL